MGRKIELWKNPNQSYKDIYSKDVIKFARGIKSRDFRGIDPRLNPVSLIILKYGITSTTIYSWLNDSSEHYNPEFATAVSYAKELVKATLLTLYFKGKIDTPRFRVLCWIIFHEDVLPPRTLISDNNTLIKLNEEIGNTVQALIDRQGS